jgi:hypothetical protein
VPDSNSPRRQALRRLLRGIEGGLALLSTRSLTHFCALFRMNFPSKSGVLGLLAEGVNLYEHVLSRTNRWVRAKE